MSTRVLSGHRLAQLLTDEGLLPPNCARVELLMPPAGPLTLRYDVFVHEDDLPKLARVFTRLGEHEAPPFPPNREVWEDDIRKP